MFEHISFLYIINNSILTIITTKMMIVSCVCVALNIYDRLLLDSKSTFEHTGTQMFSVSANLSTIFFCDFIRCRI